MDSTMIAPPASASAGNGTHVGISVPDLGVKTFSLRLVGKTPLIAHAFGRSAMAAMEASQQKTGRTSKPARDPIADFNDARYVRADGRDGFPINGIAKSIVAAVIRNMDGVKGTEARAAFSLSHPEMDEDGLVPLDAEEPEMRADRVKVGMTHSIAYRPMYRTWALDVDVTLYTPTMSAEQFFVAAKLAGDFTGIGDWRPEKSGTFGRFDVVLA